MEVYGKTVHFINGIHNGCSQFKYCLMCILSCLTCLVLHAKILLNFEHEDEMSEPTWDHGISQLASIRNVVYADTIMTFLGQCPKRSDTAQFYRSITGLSLLCHLAFWNFLQAYCICGLSQSVKPSLGRRKNILGLWMEQFSPCLAEL